MSPACPWMVRARWGPGGGGWGHCGERVGLWGRLGSASLPAGVSKIVTVDVKGNSPLWMKVKDLAEGMTYRFRIRAKTFTYGPDVEANITTGPGEGRGDVQEGGDAVGTAPPVPPGLAWPRASLYPCASSSALGPQVPLALLVSPSSPATARLSPSTGRAGTPAKGPSPDTSSKPVLQVLQLLPAFQPHLGTSSALEKGKLRQRVLPSPRPPDKLGWGLSPGGWSAGVLVHED